MTYKEVLSMVSAGFTKSEIIAMDRMDNANSQPYQMQPQQQPYQMQPQQQPYQMQPYQMQTQQAQSHPVNVLDAVQAFNRETASFDVPPQRSGTDILNEQLCQTATGMTPDQYIQNLGGDNNGGNTVHT